MEWNLLKGEAARLLFDKDALHIYAALAVQLAAARLSRGSFGDILPWLTVLCAVLINEYVDLVRGGELRVMPWQVVSGVHDILNTMILPTVLLMLSRRAPSLFVWRRAETEPELPTDEVC